MIINQAESDHLSPEFSPGQVCKGIISSIEDFAVFIDLGEADGIVTVANLSWRRIDHPSQILQVGQEVLGIALHTDPYTRQISISLKDMEPDPLLRFAQNWLQLPLSGVVNRVVPIGIFVSLQNDVIGFIPESAMKINRIEVGIGDELTVKVESINVRNRQVILSLPFE
jgi:small subunit ribosomal protein S1